MSWITMQIILAVLIFGLIGILWLLKDKNPTSGTRRWMRSSN